MEDNPENNPINEFLNNQHHVITNLNNLNNRNRIIVIVDGIRHQVNYINPDNWLNTPSNIADSADIVDIADITNIAEHLMLRNDSQCVNAIKAIMGFTHWLLFWSS